MVKWGMVMMISDTNSSTQTNTDWSTIMTIKKATPKMKISGPFSGGKVCRQNVVFTMMRRGLSRTDMVDKLPAVLKSHSLGESRNVKSLIDTTRVGIKMLDMECNLRSDGTYNIPLTKEEKKLQVSKVKKSSPKVDNVK